MKDRNKTKKFKKEGGITLIALIITIIILVILAAVSIRAVANMGIVGHAINGTQQYARAQKDEEDLFDRITKLLDNTLIEINGIQDGCGITLNKDKLGLLLEGNKTVTEKLVATVVNLEGDVSWTSSKPEVAEVSEDGTVTALSLGETVITAKIEYDGKEYSASCNVEVTNVPVTSVEVEPTSVTLDKGGEATLTASVGPENVTNKAVTWSSEDENVATVDANGKVRAVAGGTTRIIATANDGSGYSANCTVTVNVPVTGITIYKSGENASTAATTKSGTLNIGDTLTLVVVFTPSDASNKMINWTTSNAQVATVVDGVITAKGQGTATITGTAAGGNGVTVTCSITVNPRLVSSITLNETSKTLNVGDTLTLTATAAPSDATNKSVTWSSSDSTVAEVAQDGKVTAKGAGTATITATAADGSGKTATCAITVNTPALNLAAEYTAPANGGTYAGVPIPGGFTVSNESESADEGIVIYDIPAKELTNLDWNKDENNNSIPDVQENYNQFVWVPVATPYVTAARLQTIISNSNGSITTEKAALQSLVNDETNPEYPMAVQYTGTINRESATCYRGVLYDFAAGTNGITMTVKDFSTKADYTRATYYREPAYLTDSKYADRSTYNPTVEGEKLITQDILQAEYNAMVESVADNGGFYVARYELSYNSTALKGESKRAKTVSTAANGATKYWYGLYSVCQGMYNQTADKVQSLMITGAQYDQIMIWMRNVKNTSDDTKYYIKDSTGMGNYGQSSKTTSGSNNAYAVKKVFDLAGNLYEWTSEADYTYLRVTRGGYWNTYGSNYPASYRNFSYPNDVNVGSSSRATLYVK